MGIRCLFGHDFGGREVERDRREDGDEVVVAYRTVETCDRCGSRRVISENKEIKPLESVRETAGAAQEDSTPAAGAAPEESTPAAEAPSSGPQDTVTTTADDAETPESDEPETAAGSTGGAVTDATEDAAIILDDTPRSDDGAETAAASPDTPSPAPAVESDAETELIDDEPTDEAPTVVDDGETAAPGDTDETAPSDDADPWPDAAADGDGGDDGFGAESPTPGGPTVAAGDGAPAPWPGEERVERDSNGTKFVRPDSEAPDRDTVTEFHCPNCGATRVATASSLRAGDVCPDCRKGYLTERRVEGRNA